MAVLDSLVPYILLISTLVLELIAFLSSHMIDSRNFPDLHEGIFQRCTYLNQTTINIVTANQTTEPAQFYCMWWSADTFYSDNGFFLN